MKLLVSVRTPEEAEAAAAGGADLVDVKDPHRGSLGAAGALRVAEVVRRVGGRVPVSAALGELIEGHGAPLSRGLAFGKWGLAGLDGSDWPRWLACAGRELVRACPGCGPVAVAYADHVRARAPRPSEVARFACRRRWPVFLVDTCVKDGRGLLDWLACAAVEDLVGQCRAHGVQVALAGSLGTEQMARLRDVRPDWFAVRGAACRNGERTGAIDPEAVSRLVRFLKPARRPTHAGSPPAP